MEEEQETKVSKPFVIGSIIWAAIGFSRGVFEYSTNDKFHLNELGDYFAGWFAPLAFAWFMYAVFMQRKELIETRKVSKMQNEELAETRRVTEMQAEQLSLQREELEGSRKALEDQSHALNRQNVENTFFNLVKSLHDIIDAMSGHKREGRDVITRYKQLIERHLGQNDFQTYCDLYHQTYDDFEGSVSHYFRLIERIIQYVDASPSLSESEKIELVDFLRSQISNDELVVLFCHTLAHKNYGLSSFCHKYQFLAHVPHRTLQSSDYTKEHIRHVGAF
ncbi:putative phage abortive infection protein [Terasakiella pusilla]|uniref:putative phage abortive infection protein n=1 Tax=Terasakiella pusilla TaxID=64973 RepID=UPI00146FC7D9|nr:putative phage abortive infection protein [Terasakiella pusilla]